LSVIFSENRFTLFRITLIAENDEAPEIALRGFLL